MLVPIIVGILLGIVAGLLPGIHPNTMSQLLTYIELNKLDQAIIITVSASVNTVLSVLPAIFLFIPDQSTILSVLPGQRMVNNGDGLKAVWISGMAALLSIAVLVFVIPVSFFAIPMIFQTIKPFIGPILISIVLFYLLQEKGSKKLSAAFVFLLSGFLGWTILNSTVLHEPLFVSFIGLFALASMLFSVDKTSIPYQRRIRHEKISFGLLAVVLAGVVLGGLADLLPAVGSPAQLATFATPIAAISSSSFLALTMAISISHLAHSFVALNTIDKARIGSTAIIRELIGTPDFQTTILFLLISLVSIAVAVVLLWIIAIPLIQFLRRTDLRKFNLAIFAYLTVSIFLVDGWLGIFVAIVAAAIGILPVLLDVRRTNLMGFLIVPTICFWLV